MRSRANTVIVIENPTELDEYDEPVSGSDTSLGGPYPASLIERRQVTVDPTDIDKPAFVRFAMLRVHPRVPVAKDAIVVDQRTSIRWQIDEVTPLRTPMAGMDVVCELRRLSS